jgi:hypothetical protein
VYAANPSHAPADQCPCGGHCPVTALVHVAGLSAVTDYAERALMVAMDAGRFQYGIPEWNAEHTTAEVLAAWDRAIAAEEAKA